MGKSPAKWIKSVLFGKKASRSHTSKAKDCSVCNWDFGFFMNYINLLLVIAIGQFHC